MADEQDVGTEEPADATVSPALATAIREVLRARGLAQRDFLARVPRQSSRWAVYRILSGYSRDPRLSTLLVICEALEISLNELVQVAGLVPRRERSQVLVDVRLRRAFRDVQELDEEIKPLAVELVDGLIRLLAEHGRGRSRR